MYWLILILLVSLVCYAYYIYLRHKLKHKTETITAYTGGLGSGKSCLSVEQSISLYKKQMRKWKRARRKAKRHNQVFNQEAPVLCSSIPIRLGKDKYSVELTKEILLLQERLPLWSVVFIDEIGSWANQYMYNDKNVQDNFDEFVRFYRHYTKGGYMVVNDQCSENIVLTVRRRLNKVTNLSNFVMIWRIAFYYERQINISEEIKTIDEQDTQDNMRLRVRFIWNKGAYDTYCYSNRYSRVPISLLTRFLGLKRNSLLKCPRDKEMRFVPLTEIEKKEDKEEGKGVNNDSN